MTGAATPPKEHSNKGPLTTKLKNTLTKGWGMEDGGWQAIASATEGNLGDYDDVMKAAVLAQHEWKQV